LIYFQKESKKMQHIFPKIRELVAQGEAFKNEFTMFRAEFTLKIRALGGALKKLQTVLYRTNGKPGLIDKVDDLVSELEERKKAREKEGDERRRLRYYIIGAVLLILINVILNLVGLK